MCNIFCCGFHSAIYYIEADLVLTGEKRTWKYARCLIDSSCKQVDKLNVLQSDFVEVITHRHHFILYLHHRALQELLTANHSGVSAPRIENKEGDTIVCKLLFAERNAKGRVVKLRPMPAGFSFNLASKFPSFAFDQ